MKRLVTLLVFALAAATSTFAATHPAFVIEGVPVIANDYLATWAAGTPAWLHFTRILLT